MTKQHGPWKIKSSEVKYKNPWIEVCEDKVIQPDGKDGIYGTINTRNDGVSVVVLDAEDNIFLVKEFRYAQGRSMINVVCGFSDTGETPSETARREVKEETGAEVIEVVPLGMVEPYIGTLKHRSYNFIVRASNFSKQHLDPTESLEVLKIPFVKAVQMIMSGEITHAESVAVILKAAKYLGRL